MTKCFPNFLRKMIIYHLTVIHLILSNIVRLFNYSQAVVVAMGKLMCRVMSIVP